MKKQGLLAAAALFGVACSTAKYVRPLTDEQVERTQARVERGAYLVNHVMACGTCHDTYEGGDFAKQRVSDGQLAGGNVLVEHGMEIFMPNITPDEETGIGRWTDDEVMRAIRDGVRPDGSLMNPLMPFGQYQVLSDEDTRAIVAYLRTVPAKKQPAPDRTSKFPFPMGMLINRGVMHHAPVTGVPEPDRSDKVAYGRYLVNAGHCNTCHSLGKRGPRGEDHETYMGGADQPNAVEGIGEVWAPNLTPDEETGLGRYTDEQVKLALRTGTRLDGKVMAPPMIAFVPHWAGVTEEDLDAVLAYLRTLEPVKKVVPERKLSPAAKALYEPAG